GQLTWVGAGALRVQAAVGYYTSRIWEKLERLPTCPVMLHYGELDKNIPRERVEQVRAVFPQGIFYFYPADHGFNCEARASYDAPSAKLAWERTQEFLKQHIG
ncbi:MAG TPA: dienelactone hydrolase family protein, partial [Steroidobacteraceae bacterium]|nr:dienelactone hydrolase family protein [Steroidobacteraceae bacterium]